MHVLRVGGAGALAGTAGRGRMAFALVLVAAAQTGFMLPQRPERIGDGLQVALPVLGMACATVRHGAAEYVARLVALETVVHGLKHGLGDAGINLRPNGHLQGFPSGHTSAAAYGASQVAQSCGELVPFVGPAAALAAGYVGASRVESDNHDTTQVLAGALLGVASDLVLRGPRSRKRFRSAWRWIRQWLLPGAGTGAPDHATRKDQP